MDSGSLREIYRAPAPFNDAEVVGNKLYLGENGKIVSVDLQTAEQAVLCTIAQSYIWGAVGDQLYTVDDDDRTLYFIDTESGRVRHCGLVERTIGTSLKIIASTSDQVLVIYDTDAAPKGDGSFIVYGYKYGLIGKDDLFSGRDRFQPIQMIGSGR